MSNVNVNRAIAMALAGNYKIGGDGEMMIQETLYENYDPQTSTDYKSEIPLSKDITGYDLLIVSTQFSGNSGQRTNSSDNIVLVKNIRYYNADNDIYSASLALAVASYSMRYRFKDKQTITVIQKDTGGSWASMQWLPIICKVVGIRFTGTKVSDEWTDCKDQLILNPELTDIEIFTAKYKKTNGITCLYIILRKQTAFLTNNIPYILRVPNELTPSIAITTNCLFTTNYDYPEWQGGNSIGLARLGDTGQLYTRTTDSNKRVVIINMVY